MKLTDEQIEQMAFEIFPDGEWNNPHHKNPYERSYHRDGVIKAINQVRDIYEKEIQRLNLEILTMTGTIDELRDDLKRLK